MKITSTLLLAALLPLSACQSVHPDAVTPAAEQDAAQTQIADSMVMTRFELAKVP